MKESKIKVSPKANSEFQSLIFNDVLEKDHLKLVKGGNTNIDLSPVFIIEDDAMI